MIKELEPRQPPPPYAFTLTDAKQTKIQWQGLYFEVGFYFQETMIL